MPASIVRHEFPSERVWSWGALVEKVAPKPQDPLAEWTSEFAAWRAEVQQFRTFEAESFLPESQRPTAVRAHRGFLCHLISEGEKLALLLGEHELPWPGESGEIQKQLNFLDEFILNLRTTLGTWHSVEQRAEGEVNPLAAFV